MEPSWVAYLGAALILGIAAFVQSASGFGFALVAVSALPQFMPFKQAIAIIATFNLLVNLGTLWLNRAGFAWKESLPLVISSCLGIPIGFWFLHAIDSTVGMRILGAVLLVIAASDLRLSRNRHYSLPQWSAYPLGLLGGMAGGAFNVGGPPLVAFVYSQPWDTARTVAVLQTAFLASGLTRNVLMGPAGDYTETVLMTVAIAVPFGILGLWLGKRLLDRVSRPLMRQLVFGFILIMALRYLLVP